MKLAMYTSPETRIGVCTEVIQNRHIILNLVRSISKMLFDPFKNTNTPAQGINRGVTYWCEGKEQRIFYSAGSYIYAIDAIDGKPVKSFGHNGRIDLREGLGRDPAKLSVDSTSPGVIHENLLIMVLNCTQI